MIPVRIVENSLLAGIICLVLDVQMMNAVTGFVFKGR